MPPTPPNQITATSNWLDICLTSQLLTLYTEQTVNRQYCISTAKNGAGNVKGSECTPTGWHKIRARIGSDHPLHTVFVGRRPTGEIYNEHLARQHPNRDWILTRILWLSGLEPGINRFGQVDTGLRYIYIHGSPDHLIDGIPQSHGCIRMKNIDMLDLFQRVNVSDLVHIHG